MGSRPFFIVKSEWKKIEPKSVLSNPQLSKNRFDFKARKTENL